LIKATKKCWKPSITHDEWIKHKQWKTLIPPKVKIKGWKLDKWVESARNQYILFKQLAIEKIKLKIIETTPRIKLAIELNFNSKE
jgi:hypothetical protein